jgi:hypothetical protein
MQKIFSSEGLSQLRLLVGQKTNLEALIKGVAIDVSACELEDAKSLPENMPLLLVSDPTGDSRVKDDGDNSVRLHQTLVGLTARAGANPRLWSTFAFKHYQDYMLKRWPLTDAKDEAKAIEKVNDRYFLKRVGHKGYFRHGIARLWWTAYMTADMDEVDPAKRYMLTRFAFSRQEYQFGIFLRKFGASQHVARSILAFFMENEERIEAAVEATFAPDKGFVEFIRYANKQMNIYGSVYVLDVLTREKIHELMERDAKVFYGAGWPDPIP